MNISLIIFLISAFAVARISSILVEERGPFDICYHFRQAIGIRHDGNMIPDVYPERFMPQLFSCVGCLSVWVGLITTICYISMPTVLFMIIFFPFGLSGAAVVIDSLLYKG